MRRRFLFDDFRNAAWQKDSFFREFAGSGFPSGFAGPLRNEVATILTPIRNSASPSVGAILNHVAVANFRAARMRRRFPVFPSCSLRDAFRSRDAACGADACALQRRSAAAELRGVELRHCWKGQRTRRTPGLDAPRCFTLFTDSIAVILDCFISPLLGEWTRRTLTRARDSRGIASRPTENRAEYAGETWRGGRVREMARERRRASRSHCRYRDRERPAIRGRANFPRVVT